MDIFGISGIFIGITSISVAIIVFAHDYKRVLNGVWALLCTSVAVWGFGSFFIARATTIEDALFLWRITHIGVILIPVFFVHFTHIFLEIRQRAVVFFAYAVGVFFLAADATPYFISHARLVFDSFYYDSPPGILYTPFVVFFILSVVYAHSLLYAKYKIVSAQKQRQIFYFVLGTAIGFSGGSMGFLPVYEIDVPPIFNFAIVAYPLIMSYAMLKYSLFNVKVIATELLVVGIAIALFVQIFFSAGTTEIVLRGLLFVVFLGLGFLLIRSVIREVEQRELLESMSRRLAAANVELKKLDRTKSEFISIASHQLRAPLTVIKGYLSLALEGTLGKISEQMRESLQKVAFSTDQLVKLINSLLNLSRIEAGKLRYEYAMVNFQSLVEEVVGEFAPHARDKGLEISFQNKTKNVPAFMVDPDKIREAIVNLIDNAIKYSQEGTVIVTYERVGSVQNDSVRVSVQDTGLGIKKDDLKKIFTKFARTQEAQVKDPNGMGIGLYFVKRVVEDHGGRVGVTSEGLGKGSTFFIEIPLQRKQK